MEKSFRKKQKGKFIYLPFSCSSIFHCWWKNECNNLPLMLLYFLSLILQEPINNIFLMLIHCYQRNHLIPNKKKKENISFLLFNFIFRLLEESFMQHYSVFDIVRTVHYAIWLLCSNKTFLRKLIRFRWYHIKS